MLSALLLLAARAFASPSPTDPVIDELDVEDGAETPDHEDLARGTLDAGADLLEDSLAVTSGLVDVASLHELEARHQRPSPWGRIDLALGWRRVDRSTDRAAALLAMPGDTAHQRDEVWLVATWRN